MSKDSHHGFIHNLDASSVLTVIGIILLFSGAILVTLIAPAFIDPSWTEPSNPYQVQMYEVADPNLFVSVAKSTSERQIVYHVKNHYTLLSFEENERTRIIAPEGLEQFITKFNDKELKLTSRLLMLRIPLLESDIAAKAATLQKELQQQWIEQKEDKESTFKPFYEILELYVPDGNEAFALANTDGIFENWIDHNYRILDEEPHEQYHRDPGVIYIKNPREYLVTIDKRGEEIRWSYDMRGQPIKDVATLKSPPFDFHSRQELIKAGEHIFAIEGCWYCHTDQTRTLVQDLVVNGSESYPAPPSSANEYIYQKVTFPGTRRIGPDLSRVAIKRPSRDWHKGHFWSPKTASVGSIMPAFRHFFDDDPRGTAGVIPGLPNYQFEAIFQYLMTKGTRITPPNQAWWLGKDPIQVKEIIEGKKTLP